MSDFQTPYGDSLLPALLRAAAWTAVSCATALGTSCFLAIVISGFWTGSRGVAAFLIQTFVGVMEVLGPVLPSLAVLSALQIKSEFYAAIILGLLTWNGLAVFLRDEYAVLVQSTFVQAAVGLGATRTQVLWRHIIPHITARLGPLLLALFATYAGLIGALGFLGVAGDASHSLGFMIYDAKSFCRQRPSYFIGSLLCFLLLITLPHLLLRTVNSSSGTRGAA